MDNHLFLKVLPLQKFPYEYQSIQSPLKKKSPQGVFPSPHISLFSTKLKYQQNNSFEATVRQLFTNC